MIAVNPVWGAPVAYAPPALPVLVVEPSGRVGVACAPLRLEVGSPPIDVGIPSAALEVRCDPGGWGRQHSSNWCWAACIQTVLNFHGLPVQQEQLVQRVFGGLPDLPLSGPGIVEALQGWGVDRSGQACVVSADPVNLSNEAVVADLHQGHPLILGLRVPGGGGHAYVLTGARYHLDSQGRPHIDRFVVRDPWPDNPSRQELSADEMGARLMFATRVRVDQI